MFFFAFLMFIFRILNPTLLFLKLIFQSRIFVIDFYPFSGCIKLLKITKMTKFYEIMDFWQKMVDLRLKNFISKSSFSTFFRDYTAILTENDQFRRKSNKNPFLLSLDNFSCFSKVEFIRLIRFFEFCSSRVAAASV